MDLKQIKELMHSLETSRLRKLVFKQGDMELLLEKEESHVPSLAKAPHPIEGHLERLSHPSSESPAKNPKREEGSGTYVTSPMVGTFYGAPAPDQPSFVKVGDRVSESTVVCIVEAMKVMNEVKAGVKGVVAEVLAENGQPVEFGSRLLRIT